MTDMERAARDVSGTTRAQLDAFEAWIGGWPREATGADYDAFCAGYDAGYRAGAQSEQAECVRVVEDTVLQAAKQIEDTEQRVVGEIADWLATWGPTDGMQLADAIRRGEYQGRGDPRAR